MPSEPGSPAPTAPPRRRRGVRLAVVAGIAAVVVVAALAVSGVLTPAASPPGPPYPTYREALATASAAAQPYYGGGWAPIFASGVRLGSNVTVPAENLTGLAALANCTLAWIGGTAPSLVVGATPASAGAGEAAFWTFGFVNGTDSGLIVVVHGASASGVATVAGSECRVALLLAAPLTSSAVVDSPVVAANVSAAGGAAWLASNPGAIEAFEITPGVNALISSPPVWHVEYTTCGFGATGSGVGAAFYANVTAATGDVTAHGNSTVACAAGTLFPAEEIGSVALAGALSARKAI